MPQLPSLQGAAAAARNLTACIEGVRPPDISPERLLRTIRSACWDQDAVVRSLLLAHLSASGIQDRTGNLRRAVAESTVRAYFRRSGLKISVQIGRGLENFRSTGRKESSAGAGTSVYTYAAALNYGAVRQPTARGHDARGNPIQVRAIGARKARSLKKLLSTVDLDEWQVQGEGSLHPVAYRRLIRTIGSSTPKESATGKSYSVGAQIVVIKPREFFALTASEIQAIVTAIVQGVNRRLAEAAKPVPAAAAGGG